MSTNTQTAPATLTGELREIPLSAIVPSKTNPRRNFAVDALSELGESIKAQGITVPLIVRPILRSTAKNAQEEGVSKALGIGEERFELVDGERRFRAAQSVRLDKAPCVIKTLTDEQVQKVQLLSFLREDITDLEAAEGYQRLIETKAYTADTLAKELGIGRATIFDRLKLVKLTKAPREALTAGKLPASTAALIAGVPNHLQEQLTKEVLKGDWDGPYSYDDTKEHIEKNYKRNLNKALWKLDDAKLHAKAGACANCPKKQAPNMCTDPSCFEEKQTATWHQLQRDAEKNGTRIIPEATFSKAHYGTYVKASDTCYEDDSDRKYGVLAKAVNILPALTRDNEGNIIEVLEKKPLFAELAKAKVLKRSSGGGSGDSAYRNGSKKKKARRDILKQVLDPAAAQMLAAAAAQKPDLKFWKLLGRLALINMRESQAGDEEARLLTFFKIPPAKGYHGNEKALADYCEGIKDETDARVFALATFTFSGWLNFYGAEFGDGIKEIATHYGVDLEKLIAAEVKVRDEKKAAKGKKPKPAPAPDSRLAKADALLEKTKDLPGAPAKSIAVGKLAKGVLPKRATKPAKPAKKGAVKK